MKRTDHYQAAWNFLGLPDRLCRESARAWVLPVPYEGTTSYGAGTREGPAAIIAASRPIERFDSEFGNEPVEKFGVHTLPPMNVEYRSPEAMVKSIAAAVSGILGRKQPPGVLCVLGGEHSVSAGVARGMADAGLDDFVTVHIDAHADLRDRYQGSRFSHGCAARRILDCSPVFQLGIRSLSADEEAFRRSSKRIRTVFAEEMRGNDNHLVALAEFIRGRKVYFSIDLDGFDPSEMQAVGTPEPGGLSWDQVVDIARTVCREAAAVPVFDIVELAPIPFLKGPDFLAAKLAYKIMSLELLGVSKRRKKRGRG
jgi:agmatinase